jgi:hypothetical protein
MYIKDVEAFLEDNDEFLKYFRTGSSVICLDKRKAKDLDFVTLIDPADIPAVHNLLLNLGFTPDWEEENPQEALLDIFEGGKEYPNGFRSYRLNRINLIICEEILIFLKFQAATYLANYYKGTGFFENKANRVAFFEGIRGERDYDRGLLKNLLAHF